MNGPETAGPDAAGPGSGVGAELNQAAIARLRAFWAGGDGHYAIDREFAREVDRVAPGFGEHVLAEDQFRRQVVRSAVAAGCAQFIALDAGSTRMPPVHELARENPPAQDDLLVQDYVFAHGTTMPSEPVVLYVAHEAVVAAQLKHRDREATGTACVAAAHDDVAHVLHAATRAGMDLSQPVCVLAPALQHLATPARFLAAYRVELPGEHWIAITQLTTHDPGPLAAVKNLYQTRANAPLFLRSPAQFDELLSGWTLAAPGITTADSGLDDAPPPGPTACTVQCAVAIFP